MLLNFPRRNRTLSDRLMDVLDKHREMLGTDADKVEDMIVEVAMIELGDGAPAWAEGRIVSADARQKVIDFQPKPRNLCDCELSHNGCGMSGRECDCPAGAKPA